MLYFYHNYVDQVRTETERFQAKTVVQAWKDKYIKSHVSLAAPWGGAMQIVKLYASGYNMNYYRVILPPNKLRTMQR